MGGQRVVRVFISSPGDVRAERVIAERAVRRLAREFAYHFRVEPILWEREPLLASHHFQDLIVPPRETDIVIVLLWSRLGMPLPADKYLGALSRRPVTGTEWEFEDALAGYRERRLPDLLVYRKQAMSLPDSDRRDAVEEWLRQKDQVEEFMGRWFRDAGGQSATAASRRFRNGSELEAMLEEHLRALLRQRLAAGAESAATIRWHAGSPYRGLESFEPEHEQIYFGRTRARNEVRELLVRQIGRGSAFVLVMGASGSGKSSLVKAGLLPELCEVGMVGRVALVCHAITRPGAAGADAVGGLAQALLGWTALPELAQPPLQYTPERLASLLNRAPEEAAQPIRQGLAVAGQKSGLTSDAEARLLLVVDQLEELFTTEGLTTGARERYVAALQALAGSGLVWVIATMRSDFFDRLERLPALVALAGGEAKYLLTVPDGPEIGQIITQPAREAGLRFEGDAATGRSLDEVIREAAGGAGSLPLLEYLLDQLWHRRTAAGVLTFDAYRQLGGLEGAIGRRAEEALAAQPPEVQAALPRVLRALATVRQGAQATATARHARIDQFAEGSPARRLIDALLDPRARLLVAAGGTVRIAHEALLTHWERARQQIREDRADLQLRTRLEELATRWQSATGRDRASLLLAQGLPLSEAEDLLRRRRDELEAGLVAYIEASAAEVRLRQRRAGRRLQAVAAVLALFALGATIGAFYGISGRQAAISKQQEAVAAADKARSQEARAVSILARQAIASGDAQTGILAAFAILPKADDKERAPSPDAVMTLYDGWLRNRELMMLPGHGRGTRDAAFNRNGSRVLTVSQDGRALIWDVTGDHARLVVALDGHKAPVKGASFSPDGDAVATIHGDGAIRIWRLTGGRATATDLPNHPPTVESVAFSPDGQRVVTAHGDGTARVWRVGGTANAPVELKEHTARVIGAAFSPDGQRIVTASHDATAIVWNIAGARPIPLVLQVGAWLKSSAFSPDGKRIVTAAFDSTARLWDVAGTQAPRWIALGGHERDLRAAVFSPDGRRVATVSDDGTARVWDVTVAAPTARVLQEQDVAIQTVAFSPDSRRVVTALSDGTVRVWGLTPEGPGVIVLRGHLGPVTQATFSPDGTRVLTASADGTARLWNVDGERPSSVLLKKHSDRLMSGAFSADGTRALTIAADGAALSWDTASGQSAPLDLAGPGSLQDATITADGRHVATAASTDDTVQVWDLGRDRPAAVRLPNYKSKVLKMALGPDGRYLATISADGAAQVWDLRDRQPAPVALPRPTSALTVAAFSPDGRRLATGGADGTVTIWKLNGAQAAPERTLPGHAERVLAVAFSRDGRHLATSSDRTVRVLDLDDAREVKLLLGHADRVHGIVFSPDGRRIATASSDGTARVWDLGSGQPAGVILSGHGSAVVGAAFSPDGKSILTVSSDRTARIWQAFDDDRQLMSKVEATLSRCLTVEQRSSFGLPPLPGATAKPGEIGEQPACAQHPSR
jgi:WD40 repeat protein